MWTRVTWLRLRPNMKYGEFPYQLIDYHLLKGDSTPWNESQRIFIIAP
jgi:hypothetical protein